MELHVAVNNEFDDYFGMIANNVGIYVETLSIHVENYTDNLVTYMLDDSVGSMIDGYIKYFNKLHDELMLLFEPYLSLETKETIKAIKSSVNIIDDDDDTILQ